MRLAGDDAGNISVGGSVAASTLAGGAIAGANRATVPEVACGEEGGRSLVLWVGLKFRAIARSHLEFYAMHKAPKNAKDRPAAAVASQNHGPAAAGL